MSIKFEEEILCYCSGVKKQDVLNQLSNSENTIDSIISSFRLGQECTACLANIDDFFEKNDVEINRDKRELTKSSSSNKFLHEEPKLYLESGFFMNDDNYTTEIVMSNFHIAFGSDTNITAFKYKLQILGDDGRKATEMGKLLENQILSIKFKDIPCLPKSGWFVLKIIAEKPVSKEVFAHNF